MSGRPVESATDGGFVLGGDRRVRPGGWLASHGQAGLFALGQLARSLLATSMTAAVIGIALALPFGLFVALENVERVSGGWNGQPRASLFLAPEIDLEAAEALAARLGARPEISSVRLIDRAQALDEYSRLSGFDDALQALDGENPLPTVLVFEIAPVGDRASLGRLAAELATEPAVESAELDLRWVERLQAIVEIGRRVALATAVLLGLGVALVVGNTIRLAIDNRREEIEIAKLFGATDAFVRRPFLYTGLWYGILGGLFGWILVSATIGALESSVARLAALYESEFRLRGLGYSMSGAMFGLGILLGIAGGWVGVSRHLRRGEPE